ncbi:histidinol-phosphate transaminase [Curtanaerobium respiraculi]|uniref:histidinol-phosphate transaminase n=1 Tax=Curtanaerobium respiraculi TaxID=2949669 RepID=UPI0024B35D06|nr:histidinol-phosphate transaminase [Curtanaerobium respiraculi]
MLRSSNPLLAGVEPYDPKYLPADVMVSANEMTFDVPAAVRAAVVDRLADLAFNRYPDPLANELRDSIAQWYGLARDNVICGNGGDELLFNLALAWGGAGNSLINVPPTFSVYAANAHLTGTTVVDVPRRTDFTLDEDAIVERASKGDVGTVIITSPNNPTGDLASREFVERLLNATDALVLLDEAYIEFAPEGSSCLPLLAKHENLVILHTFSKAFRLAGVRLGYLLCSPRVASELTKVRQPYSVDAVSQAIALEVVKNRAAFAEGIQMVKAERERLAAGLAELPGVTVYPSFANFLCVRFDRDAGKLWQDLYDRGILVRDFSANPATRNCLRISVGTPEENDKVLNAIKELANV